MSDHPRPDMTLHWAVNDWQLPQQKVWPQGTVQAGESAVQTPFRQGGQSVALAFPEVRGEGEGLGEWRRF